MWRHFATPPSPPVGAKLLSFKRRSHVRPKWDSSVDFFNYSSTRSVAWLMISFPLRLMVLHVSERSVNYDLRWELRRPRCSRFSRL